MKIVYHHRTRRKGVEGVHIASVINELRNLGHEVIEIALQKGEPASDPRGCTSGVGLSTKLFKWFSSHAPNMVFRIAEICYNPIAFLGIVKAVLNHRPDIIYERYAYFNFAGILAGKLFKTPVILEVNVVTDMQDARRLELAPLARLIERRTLLWADAIFVVSNHLRNHLISRGFDGDKIFVQSNAFKPRETQFAEKDRRGSLTNRDQENVVIVFMGRLLPWYKLDSLIKVFTALCTKVPNVRLTMIGDGVERVSLEQKVNQRGLSERVFFAGEVPHEEAVRILSGCDIGVIPSTNLWGSPMKLFEYMGSGLPVVAPDIDVITSVMIDGVHGKVFPCDDFGGLEQALLDLIEDPEKRERMGEAAREHVYLHHTWRQVAEKIIAVTEGILRNGQREE